MSTIIALGVLIGGPISAFGVVTAYGWLAPWRERRLRRQQRADLRAVLPSRRWPG